MAVHKATRSNPPAQPQPMRRRPNPQFKAELLDTLQRLNRGFGMALAALGKLQGKTRLDGPAIFPGACLRDYRKRTEALRAQANRDLLQIFAGHEDRDATRFGK